MVPANRSLPRRHAEAIPATVERAKALHAAGLSYHKISVALATEGYVTGSGKPHAASAIQKILGCYGGESAVYGCERTRNPDDKRSR
jgi:hypothetical protein